MTSLQVKYAATSAVFFHKNIGLSGCFSETGREVVQFAKAPFRAPSRALGAPPLGLPSHQL